MIIEGQSLSAVSRFESFVFVCGTWLFVVDIFGMKLSEEKKIDPGSASQTTQMKIK